MSHLAIVYISLKAIKSLCSKNRLHSDGVKKSIFQLEYERHTGPNAMQELRLPEFLSFELVLLMQLHQVGLWSQVMGLLTRYTHLSDKGWCAHGGGVHLRRLRRKLKRQLRRISTAPFQHFPVPTGATIIEAGEAAALKRFKEFTEERPR
jgi:hypothetical protein